MKQNIVLVIIILHLLDGWIPNGLVYVNESGTGYYHLYYQFNPYCSQWDNMHWGHSRSKDLLKWEHFPPAIYRFQKGHIFSGSVVYDANGTANNASDKVPKLVAYFTASNTYQNNINLRTHGVQHNFAGYTTDLTGKEFTIYKYNNYSIGKFGRQYGDEYINPILVPEEELEFLLLLLMIMLKANITMVIIVTQKLYYIKMIQILLNFMFY